MTPLCNVAHIHGRTGWKARPFTLADLLSNLVSILQRLWVSGRAPNHALYLVYCIIISKVRKYLECMMYQTTRSVLSFEFSTPQKIANNTHSSCGETWAVSSMSLMDPTQTKAAENVNTSFASSFDLCSSLTTKSSFLHSLL